MRNHFEPIDMQVADLRLDVDNPRLSVKPKSQVQCIEELIKLNQRHFETIFKDIAAKGLTPLPIIIGRNSDGEIVVKDGNRRVAALLVLNNIDLCSSEHLKQSLRKILKDIGDARHYETIECLFCEDDDIIEDYIEHLHDGALDGAGQIGWNAVQKERHRETKGKKISYSIGFPVHTWLTNQGILDDDHNINVSNLQRLLSNKYIRNKLGFELKDKEVTLIGNEKEVIHIWKTLINDFVGKGRSVSDIKSIDQRKDYIDKLFKDNALNEPTKLDEPQPLDDHKGKKSSGGNGKSGQRRNPSWDRKRIIPINHKIVIPEQQDYNKANDILQEMRRGIEVKNAPNAAAIMLRTFIEITLTHFCDKKQIKLKDNQLRTMLNQTIAYCTQNRAFDKDQSEILKKLTREELIVSLNTFNKFVHSRTYQAVWESVNKFYNNYEFFLAYCWDEVRGGHS